MKITSFSILLIMFLLAPVWTSSLAQERTHETKVADLLNEMPARDQSHLSFLMKNLSELGKPGIESLCSMLKVPGQGDDSRVRYALGSYAFYLTQEMQDPKKSEFSESVVNSLDSFEDPDIQSFLLDLLAISGTNNAITVVSSYLGTPEINEMAVKALVGIATPESEEALVLALKIKEPELRKPVLQGLGILRSKEGIKEIKKNLKEPDLEMKKICLFALANIPDPKATNILKSAAEDEEFVFETSNATASLLLFVDRLAEEGYVGKALEISKYLIESCNDIENLSVKIYGLSNMVKLNDPEVKDALLLAASYPKLQYRAAALQLANTIPGEDYTQDWIQKLGTSNAVIKDEIITFLGERGDVIAFEAIVLELEHADETIAKAAAVSLAKLDPNKALPLFIDHLKRGNTPDILFSTDVFKWMNSEKTLDLLMAEYDAFSSTNKAKIIDLIAHKQANKYWDLILKETNSKNAEISESAFKALPNLAAASNLEEILGLLKIDSNSDNYPFVLQAAFVSLDGFEPKDKGITLVLAQLKNASIEEQPKLLPLLSGVGGTTAYAAVMDGYNSGEKEFREAAIKALVSWNGEESLMGLYQIITSNSEYFEVAYKGYLAQLDRLDIPFDQKRLYIEKLAEVTASDELSSLLIASLGKTRTFQSMIFASYYLDHSELDQVAARAVMNIALPAGEYKGQTGLIVKDLLNRVITILEGEESEYDIARVQSYLEEITDEKGYVSMFNGTDLSGWKGLVGNPATRRDMDKNELEREQLEANKSLFENWSVKDGMIVFNGKGQNLVSEKEYADFEMLVDWKITKNGDSGVYLRGSPQVQVWDTSRRDVGAQVGSGGLYNNQKHRSTPLKVADNPVGEWNTFRIRMQGERVTVFLNGYLVVDNEILENYWERDIPIYPSGPVELQAHGSDLAFKNIYIHELPVSSINTLSKEEVETGYQSLFNGSDLDKWIGNKIDYVVENGEIVIYPGRGGSGNLYTAEQYSDFILRFEFQLTPGANNGLGIRTPDSGDAAYVGMELQILDNTAEIYKNLKEYQFHGSVYGVIPAKRGYLKPVGEWNQQEVRAIGSRIMVVLNGEVILDGDIQEASKDGTIDGNEHPGLMNQRGHIGFLGHGSIVRFRNIRIKDLQED